MRTLLLAALAVPAAALAAPADVPHADLPRADVPALVHMDLTATAALRDALASTFDRGQINMLKSVAHQQAVVVTCKGFTVDKARFEGEMNLLYADAKGKPRTLTAAERAAIDKKAAFGLGLAMGAQLAIGAYDEKAFCAAAERERGTLGFKHAVWVKQVRE